MENNKRIVMISIFSKYRFWNFPEGYVQKLQDEFKEFKFIQTKNKEEFNQYLPKAEVFATFRFSPDDFKKAVSLKWLHIAGAGVGRIIFDELIKSQVIITKTSGINKEAVSEMAWSFILSLAKMHPVWLEYKKKGDILSSEIDFMNMQNLFGKTLGILGLGEIGRRIAQIGKAFELNVIGTRMKSNEPVEYVDKVYSPEGLYEILEQSDFLVVALPITPATDRMLGEKEFNAMKDGIFIINISRGQIIKEDVLIKHLKTGKVMAAGLDVIEKEPVTPDTELYTLPNVIITPHIAGYHEKYWERLYEHLKINLRRYLDRKPLLHIIDKQTRY
ncbi:MAG: D-2-hydroxyacid dehydrogenase [bacterium]|nr:D-2-hydroxyacid dehydrogenase [bacterium]